MSNDQQRACICFPGQCRGKVIDGKLPNGDICKAEFAESGEAWFEWDRSTLPTSPAQAGNMKIEWELPNGYKAAGEARDPAWDIIGLYRVKRYRWIDPRVMVLNPYTGQRRHAVDIMQDPEGRLVVPPKSMLPEPKRIPPTPPVAAPKDDGPYVQPDTPWPHTEVITDPARIEAAFESDEIVIPAFLRKDEPPADLNGGEPISLMQPRNETFSDDLEAAKAAVKTLEDLGYGYWTGDGVWRLLPSEQAFSAPDLLDAAAGHMRDRAKTYDKPEGERSMGATVQAFNAITGRDLRESEGWLLMSLLKMVRSETRDTPHRDSVEDLVAYTGLYGEARLGGV